MNSLYDEILSAIYSVWHRRWLALGVAWAVCLIGWMVVAMVPNSYESKARLYVQLDDALAQQVGIVADRKRDIERIRQTLTSAVNLEKVVRSTRIGDNVTTPKQMEGTVLGLAKDIKIVSEQDNLFQITAVSSDGSLSDAENAQLAQEIVQKMIDIFREENLAGNRSEVAETLDFVNQQLAQREKELEAAEQRRLVFEASHPEMIQGGAAGMRKLEAARDQMRNIDADIAAAESAVAAIRGQLAGTPKTVAGAGGGGARASLAQATSDLASMRSRGLTDSHPDVIAVRNQIATLRASAQHEQDDGGVGMPNPAYSSLQSILADREANVQALRARRTALQSDISSFTASQIENPEVAAEAQRISRDYDVLRQQYDKLLRDREELRLRGEVKTERDAVKFEVVDPPTTPRQPVAPNRPVLLAAVLFLGIGAGGGAAFALGQLRSTFATTARLERVTGLPVLGAISLNLTEAARLLRRRRLTYFFAGSGALAGVFVLLLVMEFVQRGMVA